MQDDTPDPDIGIPHAAIHTQGLSAPIEEQIQRRRKEKEPNIFFHSHISKYLKK